MTMMMMMITNIQQSKFKLKNEPKLIGEVLLK